MKTKKRKSKKPIWVVTVKGDHAFKLQIDSAGVFISRRGLGYGVGAIAAMTPVEACQLGLALLEASKAAASHCHTDGVTIGDGKAHARG